MHAHVTDESAAFVVLPTFVARYTRAFTRKNPRRSVRRFARKWWISRTYFARIDIECAHASCGDIEDVHRTRDRRVTVARDLRVSLTRSPQRVPNGTRARTSPATKAGLVW